MIGRSIQEMTDEDLSVIASDHCHNHLFTDYARTVSNSCKARKWPFASSDGLRSLYANVKLSWNRAYLHLMQGLRNDGESACQSSQSHYVPALPWFLSDVCFDGWTELRFFAFEHPAVKLCCMPFSGRRNRLPVRDRTLQCCDLCRKDHPDRCVFLQSPVIPDHLRERFG